MSRIRTVLDLPRNEAGLVSEFIGTAYDTVYNVYQNLPEIQRLDDVLAEIPTLAETSVQTALDAALPEFKTELQPYVDSAEAAAARAEAAATTISDQMPVTAKGTELLPTPDTDTLAALAGRIPYTRQAMIALAPALTTANQDVLMSTFVGGAVNPLSGTGFHVSILRAGVLLPADWVFVPDLNAIRIIGAQVGDVPVAVDSGIGVGDLSKAAVTTGGTTKLLKEWLDSLAASVSSLAQAAGAGNIGFKADIEYAADTVGAALQAIQGSAGGNPAAYLHLVTDRPGPDRKSWDWTPAIDAAYADFNKVVISEDIGVRTTANVPDGKMIVGGGGEIYAWGSNTAILLGDDAIAYGLNMKGDAKKGRAIGAVGQEMGNGVAPVRRKGAKVLHCEMTDFNVAAEGIYAEYLDFLHNKITDCRYCGIVGYSTNYSRAWFNTIVGLDGERDSGELNAYGITFTSKVAATDFTRYPKSIHSSGRYNLIRDIPTWHGMDTHGGDFIDYSDNILVNCRRGIILTNLGTSGASHCSVMRNKLINYTSGLNSNTTRSCDSAFWDVGSATNMNTNNVFGQNLVMGHGSDWQSIPAAYIENAVQGTLAHNRFLNSRGMAVRYNGNTEYVDTGNEIRDCYALKISQGGISDNAVCVGLYQTNNTVVFNDWTHVSGPDTATHNTAKSGIYFGNEDPSRKVKIKRGLSEGIPYPIAPATATGVTGDASGTAVITPSGLTTSPTGVITYAVVGGVATVSLPDITGVSNSGACLLTGFTLALRPTAVRTCIVRVMNNGVADWGTAILGTDGTVTLTVGASQGAFAATNNKGILRCTISYPI